jgi:hypothetical protein
LYTAKFIITFIYVFLTNAPHSSPSGMLSSTFLIICFYTSFKASSFLKTSMTNLQLLLALLFQSVHI